MHYCGSFHSIPFLGVWTLAVHSQTSIYFSPYKNHPLIFHHFLRLKSNESFRNIFFPKANTHTHPSKPISKWFRLLIFCNKLFFFVNRISELFLLKINHISEWNLKCILWYFYLKWNKKFILNLYQAPPFLHFWSN